MIFLFQKLMYHKLLGHRPQHPPAAVLSRPAPPPSPAPGPAAVQVRNKGDVVLTWFGAMFYVLFVVTDYFSAAWLILTNLGYWLKVSTSVRGGDGHGGVCQSLQHRQYPVL